MYNHFFAAPACAVMISSYEYGKLYFSRYNKQVLEETWRLDGRLHFDLFSNDWVIWNVLIKAYEDTN